MALDQQTINTNDELAAPVVLLEDDPRCEGRRMGFRIEESDLFAVGVELAFKTDTGYSTDALKERLQEAVVDGFKPANLGTEDEPFANLPPFFDGNWKPGDTSPRVLRVIAWVE